MTRIIVSAALVASLFTGCMSDREYQLRKHQLDNQASHEPTYDLFDVTGPFKLELGDNGKAFVRVPNQPFQAIPIPDGVKTQAELAKFLAGVTAGSVIGWKALDSVNSEKVTTSVTATGGAQ